MRQSIVSPIDPLQGAWRSASPPLHPEPCTNGWPFELNGNNSPAMTPTSNVFPASDGYLQITGLTDAHAAGMVEALELDGADPRLASYETMCDHHDAVRDLFATTMCAKPAAVSAARSGVDAMLLQPVTQRHARDAELARGL